MEIPRLGVKAKLQLLAYTTATATPEPSHICELYHSYWQHQILNPLSEARHRTCTLMDTSPVHYSCATRAPPMNLISNMLNFQVDFFFWLKKIFFQLFSSIVTLYNKQEPIRTDLLLQLKRRGLYMCVR